MTASLIARRALADARELLELRRPRVLRRCAQIQPSAPTGSTTARSSTARVPPRATLRWLS